MKLVRIVENKSIQVQERLKLPVFYTLLLGAFASWQSFFNIHLDHLGYGSVQIGILNAIFVSTSALVVPLWGILADRYGNNRVFLLLTSACTLLVFLIGQAALFPWMVVFIAMISIFHQPSGAVLDGMTMGFVRTSSRHSFGRFRLWSSVGYASASLVVGYFARENTSIIFHISAGLFFALSLFNLLTLPRRPVTNRNLVNFGSFSIFFHHRQMRVFLIIILAYGIAVAPLMQFINLYYNDIGANSAFVGWVFFVQAVPEIPGFLLAAWLVKRTGAERMIILSFLASMLRMFYYGLVSVPEVAIIGSILHFVTIAFFLVGVVEYVQLRTPDHLRTTGQALIWAFHFGGGVSLGNLLLGFLRDQLGMLKAMHVHAALTLLILVLTLIFFMYAHGREEAS